MSRLRVKATLDNVPHLLEVDRKSVTFDSLRSEIEAKLKIGSAFSLIYQAPTGIQYQILDDASLQRAITESTKAGARSFDLKVLRSGSSSGDCLLYFFITNHTIMTYTSFWILVPIIIICAPLHHSHLPTTYHPSVFNPQYLL
jgi:hypothetical protein